jgi:hypothetical protein
MDAPTLLHYGNNLAVEARMGSKRLIKTLGYCCMLLLGAAMAGTGNAEEPAAKSICNSLAAQLKTLPDHSKDSTNLLESLAANRNATFQLALPDRAQWARTGKEWADLLVHEHGASPDETVELVDMRSPGLIQPPHSNIWIFDDIVGSLNCHRLLAFSVPTAGKPSGVDLTVPNGEGAGCQEFLIGGNVAGTPVLLIEEAANNPSTDHAELITVAAVHDDQFDQPCGIVVTYAVEFSVENAFCDRVDCAAVMHKAEALAKRLDDGQTAEALGAEAIARNGVRMQDDYQKLSALVAADHDSSELPTFGAAWYGGLDFGESVVFPVDLYDNRAYVARLGHGHRGWTVSGGYLMAFYSLGGDRLVPVAGISLEASRGKILSVKVQ